MAAVARDSDVSHAAAATSSLPGRLAYARRPAQRARQAGKPKNKREGAARLIEGHVTQGWHEAWGEMVARWPERFADRM